MVAAMERFPRLIRIGSATSVPVCRGEGDQRNAENSQNSGPSATHAGAECCRFCTTGKFEYLRYPQFARRVIVSQASPLYEKQKQC
jgi:hypothetical protein